MLIKKKRKKTEEELKALSVKLHNAKDWKDDRIEREKKKK